MVANNEIDLALQRITAFGGESKEDKQRQFILYMLCLMELTLLGSKTKLWRKLAIEKLLSQFEEQIPIDHSLVNWNHFFSSYLMFLMACEWAQMELDYLIVYQRTALWESDWLSEKVPYTDVQFEVLLACAPGISDEWVKSRTLASIATQLAHQGNQEAALTTAQGISDKSSKSSALASIATQLAHQGNHEAAASIMQEALTTFQGISDERDKSSALASIATQLAQQDNQEASASMMQEALTTAQGISNERYKGSALASIATQLAQQGNPEALAYARVITDDSLKCSILASISTELYQKGLLKEAASVIQEALEFVRDSSSDWFKSKGLAAISTELTKHGKIEEAASVMQEAIEYAQENTGPSFSITMRDITINLAKQGKIDEAIDNIKLITITRLSREASKFVSDELAKKKNFNYIFFLLKNTLTIKIDVSLNNKKNNNLNDISTEFAKKGDFDKGLIFANQIPNNFWKSNALLSISVELHKNGLIEESYKLLKNTIVVNQDINDIYQKDIVLKDICTELFKQGYSIDAINQVSNIYHQEYKSLTLINISAEYFRQGNINDGNLFYEKALECAIGMSKSYRINSTLKKIAYEMVKVGQLQNSIECVQKIGDVYENASALISISSQLFLQGKLLEADKNLQDVFECVPRITDKGNKITLISNLSTEFHLQGKVLEGKSAMDEVQFEINELINLNNSRINPDFIIEICINLIKQNNWGLAEITGNYIKMTSRRHDCWKWISNKNIKKVGFLKALFDVNLLKSDEARLFYLKGWAENVTVSDASTELVTEALPYFVNDTESIEKIMQLHALHEVVFNMPQAKKIEQLNSTLNIQWFLDIHNSLPQSPTATRLSTNLDTWLYEIEDEDDQDQITLWAKQVAKGKITEEEFQAKIKDI
jgi:hypothetical protein